MTSKGCGKLCLDELPDVCTVRQVADVLRVAENTVYDSIRRHELPAVRLGRRVLISKSALVRFLEGHDVHSSAAEAS